MEPIMIKLLFPLEVLLHKNYIPCIIVYEIYQYFWLPIPLYFFYQFLLNPKASKRFFEQNPSIWLLYYYFFLFKSAVCEIQMLLLYNCKKKFLVKRNLIYKLF